jgi:hypothetical protein
MTAEKNYGLPPSYAHSIHKPNSLLATGNVINPRRQP